VLHFSGLLFSAIGLDEKITAAITAKIIAAINKGSFIFFSEI
jgi:hypothetical protein